MRDRTETHTLPAYWASYLINGDDSGLSDNERRRIDRYVKVNGLGACLDVTNEEEFSWDNDADELAGSTAEYTFIVLEESDI